MKVILLIFIIIVCLGLVAYLIITNVNFEWFKDKMYYRKKANALKLELDLQRKTHAHNTVEWTRQLEEMTSDIDYKTMKLKLANQENKKLKERIKELEAPKKKK